MLSVHIQIKDNAVSTPIDRKLLERAAVETLQLHDAEPLSELTLVLTDDIHIKELNRQFLGISEPTDVLAFPSEEIDPDTETLYLGDVVISTQRALVQAADGGHSIESEIQLLTVHGVLHLLGYDHIESEEKAIMWEVQAKILHNLGCEIHSPPTQD